MTFAPPDAWTPAWVRDAIFYQIFPDRFARSPRSHKPGPARGVGRAADGPRLQGRRPDRRRRAPRPPRSASGVNAIYLNPIFQSASQPPLSHVRLRQGRPDARRRRRPARAARRVPCARDAGRARRRLQPREPRVLAVPPHPRERARPRPISTGSSSIARRSPGGSRSAPTRSSRSSSTWPRSPPSRCPGTRRWSATATWPGGACRPCPSSTSANPAGPRVPAEAAGTGSGSASTAGGSTSPTRSTRRLLARVPRRVKAVDPDAYIVGEVWHEAPRLAAGRHVRRRDELPVRRGDHRRSSAAGRLDRRVAGPALHRAGPSTTRTRRPSRRDSQRAARGLRPGGHRRSSSTCSTATTRRGSSRWPAATRARCAWRRSSR